MKHENESDSLIESILAHETMRMIWQEHAMYFGIEYSSGEFHFGVYVKGEADFAFSFSMDARGFIWSFNSSVNRAAHTGLNSYLAWIENEECNPEHVSDITLFQHGV